MKVEIWTAQGPGSRGWVGAKRVWEGELGGVPQKGEVVTFPNGIETNVIGVVWNLADGRLSIYTDYRDEENDFTELP